MMNNLIFKIEIKKNEIILNSFIFKFIELKFDFDLKGNKNFNLLGHLNLLS